MLYLFIKIFDPTISKLIVDNKTKNDKHILNMLYLISLNDLTLLLVYQNASNIYLMNGVKIF